MLSGRGKFQKRRVVDGGLAISVSVPTDDERLRDWIVESRAVLPRLRSMVENGHREPAPLEVVVEDLRRRVAVLEQELARLRWAFVRASSRAPGEFHASVIVS